MRFTSVKKILIYHIKLKNLDLEQICLQEVEDYVSIKIYHLNLHLGNRKIPTIICGTHGILLMNLKALSSSIQISVCVCKECFSE